MDHVAKLSCISSSYSSQLSARHTGENKEMLDQVEDS